MPGKGQCLSLKLGCCLGQLTVKMTAAWAGRMLLWQQVLSFRKAYFQIPLGKLRRLRTAADFV